jgi:hypothetical protein
MGPVVPRVGMNGTSGCGRRATVAANLNTVSIGSFLRVNELVRWRQDGPRRGGTRDIISGAGNKPLKKPFVPVT